VIGREDHPEYGRDRVEALVVVRKLLAVALVEPDARPLLVGSGARLGQLLGRDVEAGDLGSRACGDQGNATGTAGEVEELLARDGCERADDALVDRPEGLRDSLVAGAAPVRRRLAQPSFSCARFVSSVRTFQSSG
jgi:hypothetical protein